MSLHATSCITLYSFVHVAGNTETALFVTKLTQVKLQSLATVSITVFSAIV